jgi:lipopolysaccharide transport system permease protein
VTLVLTALLNFTIIFGLFTAFLLISGNFPGLPYLAMVPLLFILILFSIGLGIIVGVLNVFFRDVGQFFGVFLTFWFWLTPIVYPPSILSEGMREFLAMNPMTPLMGGFQTVFVEQKWPVWENLWVPGVLSLVFCVIGLALFRKRAGEMVDEL